MHVVHVPAAVLPELATNFLRVPTDKRSPPRPNSTVFALSRENIPGIFPGSRCPRPPRGLESDPSLSIQSRFLRLGTTVSNSTHIRLLHASLRCPRNPRHLFFQQVHFGPAGPSSERIRPPDPDCRMYVLVPVYDLTISLSPSIDSLLAPPV